MSEDSGPIPDDVLADLLRQLLAGEIAPGHSLVPAEIAENYQVTVPVVFDALDRLERTGLVDPLDGGAYRVLDWRNECGLDMLSGLAQTGVVAQTTLLRDLADMRRSLGADAAALCAERASQAQLTRVLQMAAGYPKDPADIEQLIISENFFWDAVVDGTGNIAYRLALNTVRRGVMAMGVDQIAGLLEEYADRDGHRVLAATIARRDSVGARIMATALLGGVLSDSGR